MRLTWIAEISPARETPSWLARATEEIEPLPPSPPLPIVEVPSIEPSIRSVDYEEEIAGLRAALAGTLARLASLRLELARDVEPELVKLAVVIAERVIDASVTCEQVLAWTREGMAALDAGAPLTVKVSAHVRESIPQEEWDALGATVLVDASLPRWGCVVESGDARIDNGASARLREVAEALGVEVDR